MKELAEHRITRQRQVILNAVRESTGHPTASEIYEMARKSLPRISLGTVYRNLQVLSDSGMVRTLKVEGSKKHFDRNISRHNHILCTCCGRVEDVGYDLNADVEKTVGGISGYKVTGHCLTFTGVCPRCKNRK